MGEAAAVNRDAVISDCGRFRYLLRRSWSSSRPRCTFVMLNPSTADASIDDPTIRRCIGFADRLGFDGLNVVNLSAFRATDPADLKRAGRPIGPECDFFIEKAIRETSVVVCAWGAHARRWGRVDEVLDLIRATGRVPQALRITAGGEPSHPLMLPYSCQLAPLTR